MKAKKSDFIPIEYTSSFHQKNARRRFSCQLPVPGLTLASGLMLTPGLTLGSALGTRLSSGVIDGAGAVACCVGAAVAFCVGAAVGAGFTLAEHVHPLMIPMQRASPSIRAMAF